LHPLSHLMQCIDRWSVSKPSPHCRRYFAITYSSLCRSTTSKHLYHFIVYLVIWLTDNLDGSCSCSTTNCAPWPWYVQCLTVTVSYRDAALVMLPEGVLLLKGHHEGSRALITGVGQYASFAEHSNFAKAVDEALFAEKEGIDEARLSNALLQIAVNNPFTVHSSEKDNMYVLHFLSASVPNHKGRSSRPYPGCIVDKIRVKFGL
jgi:hypothetical protein